jgi:CheY-like chemotaxis protein/anti-sigma regulatory factor (Ser/Thr protein kinase)
MVLSDFIQSAYSTFKPMAEERGLKFQVQLRGSIPAYVESDPEQLMQILRQVVGNAIRFSEEGLVKLTVTASRTTQGRREIALLVSDQGPGIPSDLRKRIFKPFTREEASATKTHSGTGLGLTIARKLARGLGGDVKLAKSSRRGTTFLITFDGGAVDQAHELLDQLALFSPSPTISPDDPHALENIRVLVVDDSPDAALLVSRMLKVVGADVDTANRGQQGVEKAMSGRFDVVLMDIQMPEMDGNEAIRKLRAEGFTKPIIALSAHAMKEDQEETERAGADEYLTKPVSRRALLEMVGRYACLQPHRVPRGFGPVQLQPAH